MGLDRSSQWVLGKNATAIGEAQHLERHALILKGDRKIEPSTLVQHDRFSYVPVNAFEKDNAAFILYCMSATTSARRDETDKSIQSIADKGHKRVFNITVQQV